MAVRSKSSKAWLHEHINDHYVHMAQKDGYRARAAYKLLEINENPARYLPTWAARREAGRRLPPS